MRKGLGSRYWWTQVEKLKFVTEVYRWTDGTEVWLTFPTSAKEAGVNLQKLIDSLERFGNALPMMVAGLSQQDAAWKPSTGNWSILEIVCHLIDEEAEDFVMRLKSTLENPKSSWPSWDPTGVAVSRNYNEQNFGEKVNEFVAVRKQSLVWLRHNLEADWNQSYDHPSLGMISAGDLLAAWTAHDQLHVRQIGKRMFELVSRDAKPYSVSYAGPLT